MNPGSVEQRIQIENRLARELGDARHARNIASKAVEDTNAEIGLLQDRLVDAEQALAAAEHEVTERQAALEQFRASQTLAARQEKAAAAVAAAQRAAVDRAQQTADNLARAQAEHIAAQEALAVAITAKGETHV